MKKKKVWRYYCEFCKKAGCSGGHMKNHEASCTNNPDRICRMCRIAGLEQQPTKDLIAALGIGDKDGVEKLRELAEGCPACMLAAIRQSCVLSYERWEDGFPAVSFESWDYQEEKKAFWKKVNE